MEMEKIEKRHFDIGYEYLILMNNVIVSHFIIILQVNATTLPI